MPYLAPSRATIAKVMFVGTTNAPASRTRLAVVALMRFPFDSNGRRFIPDLLSRLTPALAHIVRRVMSPSAERICGKGKSGHSSHPRPRATPLVTETIARILTINDGCSAVGFVASEDESVGSTTKCRRSDPNVGGRTRKALTTWVIESFIDEALQWPARNAGDIVRGVSNDFSAGPEGRLRHPLARLVQRMIRKRCTDTM